MLALKKKNSLGLETNKNAYIRPYQVTKNYIYCSLVRSGLVYSVQQHLAMKKIWPQWLHAYKLMELQFNSVQEDGINTVEKN